MSASEASLAGPAGALVATVQGLSDLGYRSHASAARNPETGTPYAGVPLSAAGPDGLFFSADCLRPPQAVTFTTGGGLPTATYFGNRYGAEHHQSRAQSAAVRLRRRRLASSLRPEYTLLPRPGRTGQTIMIVDAFGSNTIVTTRTCSRN